MESKFPYFGFTSNAPSYNAFETLSKAQYGSDCLPDTVLRLDSPGAPGLSLSSSKGIKRKWGTVEDAFSLHLGLGHSSSSSDSKGSSATLCTLSSAKETDEETSMDLGLNFELHLGSERTPTPRKPTVAIPKPSECGSKFDLQLSLSTGVAESVITTNTNPFSVHHFQNSLESSATVAIGKAFNEATVSSYQNQRLRHSMPSPIQHSVVSSFFSNPVIPNANPDPVLSFPDISSTIVSTPKSSVTCTSGPTHQRHVNSKTCQFQGCGKGARGASGLCIAHGGGRRCQKEGCHKGAEGRTVYCKAHGGGRRCEHLGCTKSAEGRTDFCIAHGGGRRCSHEGCTRAARGKSGLCIRHGGGKRCQRENCTKSAEGFSGLCISHGGGRRCQYPACTKGAQGSTMFCKAHGGGKRCTIPGCNKGAEGSTPYCKGHGGGKRCSYQGGGICPKSVHGGTQFCVAHGGGKRCAVQGCTKSARGRTDYCVRHGGGKRCKSEGCGKSAQGSTDFCKAHGGGKRCSWGRTGSPDLGGGQAPCDRFARGKTGLCAAHTALVQDRRIHGGGTLGPTLATTWDIKSSKPEKMKDVMVEDMHVDVVNNFGGWSGFGVENYAPRVVPLPVQVPVGRMVHLPEGRVHGGSLMALLARGAASEGIEGEVGPSKQGGRSSEMLHTWM
ncbi:hypothetical protein QJS10_CPA01g02226 [Acorus calamus]|uniref:WRKY19-like zinc finger domain-containing protein n=1 Tax=Acorus calamus TaxID=4465 RepID=A0AAV9FFK9_ACOCL|nr:hypothetical protein QJS10_CPA01g02226 [Acorus calamus]